MAKVDLWHGYCRLKKGLKLSVLLFAGREAAAAFRIACPKGSEEREIATEALVYEPFTYWDWQTDDAKARYVREQEGLQAHTSIAAGDDRRKRRLLWERERDFWEAHDPEDTSNTYPSPRQRWETFRDTIEREVYNCEYVKRIAVAPWMTAKDMEWIARRLPRLEALDLSNVPEASTPNGDGPLWPNYLDRLENLRPRYITVEDLELFTYRGNKKPDREKQTDNVLKALTIDLKHKDDQSFRLPGPVTTKNKRAGVGFEEFFWGILDKQKKHVLTTGQSLSAEIQKLEKDVAESHLWGRLRWLGIRDRRHTSFQGHVLEKICARCHVLETLSVRGRYGADAPALSPRQAHAHACRFITDITESLPGSVRTVQLRLSLGFLKYFLEKLIEQKPNVTRVGVDFGAWVHIYPLRSRVSKGKRKLVDTQIRERAILAAREIRFATYEAEYNKLYSGRSAWHLPETKRKDATHDDHQEEELFRKKQQNYYQDISGSDSNWRPLDPIFRTSDTGSSAGVESFEKDGTKHIDRVLDKTGHKHTINVLSQGCADTLPKMLKMLFDVGEMISSKNRDKSRGAVRLYALEPEQEERSNDPINPFELIQSSSVLGFDDYSGADYTAFIPEDLEDVYPWLESTFKWRPVFDWDCLMLPGELVGNRHLELRGGRHYDAYKDQLERDMDAIRHQFELLKEAGIPVHVLIGRRSSGVSSCYWGWPYCERSWQRWKEEEFSASLENVVGLIDTLSIFYDLRNPLDRDRLEEIWWHCPHVGSHALGPKKACPWKDKDGSYKKCPFYNAQPEKHPRQQVSIPGGKSRESIGRQIMANKITIKPGENEHDDVATSWPPPGEDANDHPSDDSDSDGTTGPRQSTLLHLARRAAFTREGLGWQRFWSKYALQFRSLTLLRVRMPRAFDKIGSWRLAKLLDRSKGWEMLSYGDERQHIQTAEILSDLPPDTPVITYRHKEEEQVYPAGRFVRRAWVRKRLIPTHKFINWGNEKRHLELEFSPIVDWGARDFEDGNDDRLDVEDQKEYDKVDRKADRAGQREQKCQRECEKRRGLALDPTRPEPTVRFQSSYEHHIRNVAGSQWRAELRRLEGQIHDLTAGICYAEGLEQKKFQVLQNTARALQRRVQQQPPYDKIFLRNQRDWVEGIALQEGDERKLAKLERERREWPQEERIPSTPPHRPGSFAEDRPSVPSVKDEEPLGPGSAVVESSVCIAPTGETNPFGDVESPLLACDKARAKRPPPFTQSSSPSDEEENMERQAAVEMHTEETKAHESGSPSVRAGKGAETAEVAPPLPEPDLRPLADATARTSIVPPAPDLKSGTTGTGKERKPAATAGSTKDKKARLEHDDEPAGGTLYPRPDIEQNAPPHELKGRSEKERKKPKGTPKTNRTGSGAAYKPPGEEAELSSENEFEEEGQKPKRKPKTKKGGSSAAYRPEKDANDDSGEDEPKNGGRRGPEKRGARKAADAEAKTEKTASDKAKEKKPAAKGGPRKRKVVVEEIKSPVSKRTRARTKKSEGEGNQ